MQITKEILDKYWHLFEAIKAGKTIQFNINLAPFVPQWNDIRSLEAFEFPPESYRIKPEPEPKSLYQNVREMMAKGFLWACPNESNYQRFYSINCLCETGIWISGHHNSFIKFKELDYYTLVNLTTSEGCSIDGWQKGLKPDRLV